MATEDKRAYSRKSFLVSEEGGDIQEGSLQRIADAMEKILPGLDRGFDRLTAATAQASLSLTRLGEQLALLRAENVKLRAANERLRRAAQVAFEKGRESR